MSWTTFPKALVGEALSKLIYNEKFLKDPVVHGTILASFVIAARR